MLKSVLIGKNRINLVDKKRGRFPGANTFTVIVGKNGTGKSRLLRAITMGHLLEVQASPRLLDREARRDSDLVVSLDWEELPSRTVAVSTSPFDKFPLVRASNADLPYKYLGLRGLPSTNLGVTYLSKVFGTLLEAIVTRPGTSGAIGAVLRYLGYEPSIDITLQLAPPGLIKRLSSGENVRMLLPSSDWAPAYRFWEFASPSQREHLLRLVDRVDWSSRKKVHLQITPEGVDGLSHMTTTVEQTLELIQAGLIKLSALTLRKKGDGERFNVNDASSGEQAVVMSLLGIGSQIQDGALILIDEPEVCLHPEWQEKYIHLLFQTFSQYRGCHFIIATHSPQIVAELPAGNCFVLTMEDHQIHRAAEFSGRSVDFQLASVFNAPGYKNEYLLRMALGAFTDLSKGIDLDSDGLEALNVFASVVESLRDNDPVKDLIEVVLELSKRHG